MSPLTASPGISEHQQLERLCVSIRGKLQFMDYLVRAAVADAERFQEESDAGTRIFIRQLIEMHATSLSAEADAMGLVQDFCNALGSALDDAAASVPNGDAA
jgi:hypothetical protein